MRKPTPNRIYGNRGTVEIIALFVVVILCLTMAAGLLFNRSATIITETVDRIRQSSVQRRALEEITREVILSKLETAPTNSASSSDSTADALLAAFNAGSQGITLARNGATPNLAAISHRMFPSASVPSVSAPDLSIAGRTYQTKKLIAASATQVGASLIYNYNIAVASNSAENRSVTVSAQLWSVPISNWTFIAYGLPASRTVPSSTPANVSSVTTSVGFTAAGGRPFVLTTLRPSPAYASGDTTAFNQLYSAPALGNPETLPAYYRNDVSLNWNAFEFIWAGGSWPLSTYNSGYYQDRLLQYAMSVTRNTGASRSTVAAFDMSSFNPTLPTGVTMSGSTVTVDIGAYPEDVLYLIDGAGGYTVNLTGAPSNTLGPLVLVVSGQGTSQTSLNITGTNERTVLIYTRNGNVTCNGPASLGGGLMLDPGSRISGTLSLNGIFAFYAADTNANPFPGFNLNLAPAGGGLLADIQSIAPRVLLVATSSTVN